MVVAQASYHLLSTKFSWTKCNRSKILKIQTRRAALISCAIISSYANCATKCVTLILWFLCLQQRQRDSVSVSCCQFKIWILVTDSHTCLVMSAMRSQLYIKTDRLVQNVHDFHIIVFASQSIELRGKIIWWLSRIREIIK